MNVDIGQQKSDAGKQKATDVDKVEKRVKHANIGQQRPAGVNTGFIEVSRGEQKQNEVNEKQKEIYERSTKVIGRQGSDKDLPRQ
jgi:hypothetical protein